MGFTISDYRYRINGVLSTDATVMENMETLSRAAQSWFTYDVTEGKWAVIINTTGNSIASFDNSNITGPVSISGTGLSDLYNRVRVEFPHVDLDDQVDFVEIAIPSEDRNPNEPDNTLNISFDVINDPVMAEMLGFVELKQSRVDKVIRFTTDYSYIGLKAGDLIDVTNSVLGYTNKVFRIISLEEADDEAISISITATEYDANVYDVSDLFRYERSNENGIVTKGAIDPPTTPIITAYEQTARPGVDLETTVPSGIVEKIEFWYSTDNTNFILVGTESPSGGGTYEFADTVIFNYDKFDAAGNVFVKCRAVNSTTASEYSPTASLIGFTPVQVTDAIGFDTVLLDEFGDIDPLQLALPLALAGLDAFLGGDPDLGAAVDGAVTDSIENGNLTDTLVENGAMIVGDVGQVNVGNCPANGSNASSYTTVASSTFVSRYTSSYKVDVIVDQNTSGAIGARGADFGEDEDIVRVRYQLFDISGGGNVYIGGESSGGVGAFFWTDYSMTGIVDLEATKTYKINFETSLYTESNNVDGDFTFGWNIYTAG
jgi:hypothetical protein